MRPSHCKRCKRGHNGDGEWVKPYLWSHDNYLRQTVANIKKHGEMIKVEACPICVKEIRKNGHIVRERSQK